MPAHLGMVTTLQSLLRTLLLWQPVQCWGCPRHGRALLSPEPTASVTHMLLRLAPELPLATGRLDISAWLSSTHLSLSKSPTGLVIFFPAMVHF